MENKNSMCKLYRKRKEVVQILVQITRKNWKEIVFFIYYVQ